MRNKENTNIFILELALDALEREPADGEFCCVASVSEPECGNGVVVEVDQPLTAAALFAPSLHLAGIPVLRWPAEAARVAVQRTQDADGLPMLWDLRDVHGGGFSFLPFGQRR